MQSNGWPFKLPVFFTVHWALNSDAYGFIYIFMMYVTENESLDTFLTLVQKINQNCAERRNLY
jgi:hypothetical protein